MPANRAWPGIPGDFDAAKKMEAELELFKAQLEIQKAKDQSSIDREKTEAQNNFDRSKDEFSYYYAMLQAINTGFIDVAKGAIDRSIQRADFVQKVATALGTIYSGVLAYSLSVDKEKHLTFSGMLPVVFLGLAFVFSAFYVSFITRSKDIEIEESDGTLPGEIHSQLNTFIAWATAPVMERRAFLHSSIISLGFGILFLPLPYLGLAENSVIYLLIAALLIACVPLIVPLFHAKNGKEKDSQDSLPPVEANL